MPNKRSSEDDYREKISIRLPRRLLKKIEEIGTKTEVIEKAVNDYLKKEK